MTRYRHTETLTWEDDYPHVDGTRTLLLQVVQGRTGWRDAKVLGTWERIDDEPLKVGDYVRVKGRLAVIVAFAASKWAVVSFADTGWTTPAPVVVLLTEIEPR